MGIIYEQINGFSGEVTKIVIVKNFYKSISMARHCYNQYLKEKKNTEKANQERKTNDHDKNEFKKTCICYIA